LKIEPAHKVDKPEIVVRSRAMRQLLETATRAAARQNKVLITGESGVGKDVLARFIHAHSPRAAHPFVAVNCAGLAETLLESELFGHVKGSFTGAYRDKRGKLELADGGTIFLDEVGEMTPRMQALLLRFLESGEVQPVGADSASRRVNARVVAATNRDLDRMTAAGTFREDLLYRIRVVHLHVPPLRERVEDIRPLLEYFLNKIDPAVRLSDAAWALLERHHWPGNVREVQNVVEQLSAAGHDRELDVADMPPYAAAAAAAPIAARGGDRRRTDMDALFDSLANGTSEFWRDIYDAFIERDLTRQDVRHIIMRGLAVADGSYRELLQIFRLPGSDYKRLLNFLVRHGCTVDFRPFRPGQSGRRDVASDTPRRATRSGSGSDTRSL
jgi:transcriptional regulator with PAS, ATPase and Fis domain